MFFKNREKNISKKKNKQNKKKKEDLKNVSFVSNYRINFLTKKREKKQTSNLIKYIVYNNMIQENNK